ncbi:MAG: phenylalanine--tRNA ligase subunit beta [Chloroflexota bacterium]
MKIPLSWLKDYVDITIPVEELAHRLTLAGLEVSKLTYIGIPAGEVEGPTAVPYSTDHLVWDREKIVLGHILEVKSHPDADRLVLAVVDSGLEEPEVVVTGAPNLYPYKDVGPIEPPLIAPYAREGAEVIDGHKEDGSRMILKPRVLRGIENRSMVCSEKELGFSDEHEGIMLIESDAAPGTPLQDVLGDVIFDLDLTPNLARCFSMVGVAREVAALTGQKVRYPPTDVVASGPSIEGQVSIEIVNPKFNPRFTVALIKDVEIKPSPEIIQRRLKLAGMRPINNMVDVTNYVMLETGQPLHAFDYGVLVERAGGKAPTITIRQAEPGETLTTLDGIQRELDPFTTLICDTAGTLSLAGIMGGADSEVYDASKGEIEGRTESTQHILLEAANWDYINVRQTLSAQRERGKEIGSEAGVRFSRGVHPAVAEEGLLRGIELMRVLGGGEVAAGYIDEYPLPAPTVVVNLPLSEVERILGIALSQKEVTSILEGLEFGVEKVERKALRVTVPDHRLDIGQVHYPEHEDIRELVAQADLIEEIARIYGYDRIPNTLMADLLPPQRANVRLEGEERVRDILTNAGLQEIIAYRLTTPANEARLVPPDAASDWPDYPYLRIANPISQDRVVMRHTVLAGMLDILARNTTWQTRQALFEIGQVYLPVEGALLPEEPRHLGIVLSGERSFPDWGDGPDQARPLMDYFDLKGVLDRLIGDLHLEEAAFEAGAHSTFYPGRTAILTVRGERVGTAGELHPLVARAFELPDQPVLVAELDLDLLLSGVHANYLVAPISNYPAIYQDIAVVVDEAIPAAEVEAAIRGAGGSLLREVHLFDVYRGAQIGAGKKSLAYGLTFQADDRTLRDKDADKQRMKIVKAVERQLGAKLRA